MSTGTNLSDDSIARGGTVDSWLGVPKGGTAGNDAGARTLVRCTTANIPSAVAGYAPACLLQATDTGFLYTNIGTAASASFKLVDSQRSNAIDYNTVAVNTTGTNTSVNVFGAAGAPSALTITAVQAINLDVNAGNVFLINGTSTVATIAKGTSLGLVTGANTLTNTAVASGAVVAVQSDGSGEATMLITFTIP